MDSELTLDVSGDDTFADAQAGDRNVCVTVWGTVKSNDGSAMVLSVDRAELMPEDYSDEDDEDDDESEETPTPRKSQPKHVVAIMIGEKPKGQ